jgi:hypothetical protein
LGLVAATAAVLALGGCATGWTDPDATSSTAAPTAPTAATAAPAAAAPPASGTTVPPGGQAPAVSSGTDAAAVRLPPAPASRSWQEFRVQAARRMVAANPTIAHTGPVREPLLAIPVLEVDLNADGSVRRIQVLRRPGQAPDTVQLAIDAVHRGGPYGDVSRLPRPWRFTEAFLFNDDRRFKPRTLDP